MAFSTLEVETSLDLNERLLTTPDCWWYYCMRSLPLRFLLLPFCHLPPKSIIVGWLSCLETWSRSACLLTLVCWRYLCTHLWLDKCSQRRIDIPSAGTTLRKALLVGRCSYLYSGSASESLNPGRPAPPRDDVLSCKILEFSVTMITMIAMAKRLEFQ